MSTEFLPRFPIKRSLSLVKGDAWGRAIAIQTPDGLHDTTGWVALLQIRHRETGAVLVEASTANGLITVGIQGTAPHQYNLKVDIPKVVTASLTDWGVGDWQLEAGPDSTRTVTYFGGDAWLTPDVAF